MTLKRAATIVVAGAVLAAWLAGAATSTRVVPPPIVARPAAVDASGDALAKEIARLHERLRPAAVPTQPGRNLFTFRAAPVHAPPPAPAPAAIVEAPLPAPAPAMKLVGIAEDAGDNGPVRTAFVSSDGQLLMLKEGDVVGRYRVNRISPDVVELADDDGTVRRLAMR